MQPHLALCKLCTFAIAQLVLRSPPTMIAVAKNCEGWTLCLSTWSDLEMQYPVTLGCHSSWMKRGDSGGIEHIQIFFWRLHGTLTCPGALAMCLPTLHDGSILRKGQWEWCQRGMKMYGMNWMQLLIMCTLGSKAVQAGWWIPCILRNLGRLSCGSSEFGSPQWWMVVAPDSSKPCMWWHLGFCAPSAMYSWSLIWLIGAEATHRLQMVVAYDMGGKVHE